MNDNKRITGVIVTIFGISLMILFICLSLVSIYMSAKEGSSPFPPFLGTVLLPIGISALLIGAVIVKKNSPNSWETIYKNHKIRAENGEFRKLFVDEKEQDSRFAIRIRTLLKGTIKHEEGKGEIVEVKLGGFWKPECKLSVDGKSVPIFVSNSISIQEKK